MPSYTELSSVSTEKLQNSLISVNSHPIKKEVASQEPSSEGDDRSLESFIFIFISFIVNDYGEMKPFFKAIHNTKGWDLMHIFKKS